jgi:vitamin B12 transporter
LQPEQSVSSEIGLDQSFLDGTFLLQISLFHQDLDDEINGFVFDPVTFLATAENRGGESNRDGAEIAARWTVSNSFELGAHYTYTDATEQDFSGDDVHELRRPKHTGGLSADLRALDERFSASLNANYSGTRTDIFFPPFPNSSEIVTLSNYWLVDLALHYKATESITLFARAQNLFDEDYQEVFGYQTSGVAGFAGVRMNFGPR